MLNYAFPYGKKDAEEKFSALVKVLVDALNAKGKANRSMRLAAFTFKPEDSFSRCLALKDTDIFISVVAGRYRTLHGIPGSEISRNQIQTEQRIPSIEGFHTIRASGNFDTMKESSSNF